MSLLRNCRQLVHFSRNSSLNNCEYRLYATSRFPQKVAGAGRARRRIPTTSRTYNNELTHDEPLNESGAPHTTSKYNYNSSDGLASLLREDTLVIERQIEMLNIFVGFEQSNKYTISSETGVPLGYIAEQPKGFMGAVSRQLLATHRPFRAVVMDPAGTPILWLKRPFSWINSRMSVQRSKGDLVHPVESEPKLDVFGEVHQIWHPWRRRYDIFIREKKFLSSLRGHGENLDEASYSQIGKVDAGFLSWNFNILNEKEQVIADIQRAFTGFGREIFTDTGKYTIRFRAPILNAESAVSQSFQVLENFNITNDVVEELESDTRALLLGLAINIDFDYFSRHSHVGGGGGLFGFHTSSWD